MMKNYLCLPFFVFALFYSSNIKAQNCTSSLGDPVFKETFGAGSNPGFPLPYGITNLNYWTNNYVAGQGYTCPNDNNYSIANITTGCFSNHWITTRDHTGDANGYFMMINASYDPSDFYVRKVSGLCGGNIYEFSAWIINLSVYPQDLPPNITFRIEQTNGVILDTLSTGNIYPVQNEVWKKYSFYFKTPIGITDVVLRMKNNAPGGIGNDVGLDDIVFQPVGPSVSLDLVNAAGNTISVCKQKNPVSLSVNSKVEKCYVSTSKQWQVKNNITQTWTDIPGATDTALTFFANTVGNFQYRLSVAQLGNINSVTCRVYSAPIYVNVTEIDTLINKKICLGTSYLGYNKTGTYIDSFYNTFGCDSFRTLNLTVIAPPPVPLALIEGKKILCIDESVSLTNLDSGGVWKSFDNLVATITNNGVVTGINLGTAFVHYVVTNMCGSDSAVTFVTVEGLPMTKKDTLTKWPTCYQPFAGSIFINGFGKEAPYSFFLNGHSYTPPSTITNLGEGNYAAYFYNNIGCLVDSIAPIMLKLINDGSCDTLYVPTSFMPNSTNGNKVLKPFGPPSKVKSSTFKVYNRYGNLIFKSNNINQGWDGRINGLIQEAGTYIWYLQYTLVSGIMKQDKGVCVLIR